MRLSVTTDEESLLGSLPPLDGVCIQKEPHGIVFTCAQEQMKNVKAYLAKSLPDIIIKSYEKNLLSNIIKTNCKNFSKLEQQKILRGAQSIASDMKRNLAIEKKLSEYLATSDNLVVDGFVNFRLKDYKNSLQGAVEIAVDRYLAETEYNEFISLLKYFIDIQTPGEQLLHIVPEDGEYKIFNERLEDITAFCTDIIYENDLTAEDILLSSLITVAPQNIILHGKKYIPDEFLQTLALVFGDRILLCEGCDICK